MDPYKSWEYRSIECQLFKYTKPDGFRWGGYIKIGDEWLEVLNADDIDEDDAVSKIESRVDLVVMKAKGEIDEKPEIPQIDPPRPAPQPVPASDPWKPPTPDPMPGPIWIRDDDDDILGGGTYISDNTDDGCTACRRLQEGTTWRGEHPPKCVRHRENGDITVTYTGMVDTLSTTTESDIEEVHDTGMPGTPWG